MDKAEIKAVEMVRAIRDRFYEETKGLSPEELMAFIRREAAKTRQAEADEASSRRPAA